MSDDPHIVEEKDVHKHINYADSATDTAQNLIDILHRLHAFLAPSLIVLFAVLPPLRIAITFSLLSAEGILMWQLNKKKENSETWRNRHSRLVYKIGLGLIILISLGLSVALPHIALTMYITGVAIEFVKDLVNLKFHKQQYDAEADVNSPQRTDMLGLQLVQKICDCTANTVALIGALLLSVPIAKFLGMSVSAASAVGMNLLLGAGVATVAILVINEVSRFVSRAYHQAKLIKELNRVEDELSELVIPEKLESIADKKKAADIYKAKLELSKKKKNLLLTEHDNESKLIYGGIKTVGNIAVLIGVVLTITMLSPLPGLLLAGGAFFAGTAAGFISNRLRAPSRKRLEVEQDDNVVVKAQKDYNEAIRQYELATIKVRELAEPVLQVRKPDKKLSVLPLPSKQRGKRYSLVSYLSFLWSHRAANDDVASHKHLQIKP